MIKNSNQVPNRQHVRRVLRVLILYVLERDDTNAPERATIGAPGAKY